MSNGHEKNLQLKVRPETRDKIDAIAAVKRWTIAETVDAIADAFLTSPAGKGIVVSVHANSHTG